MILALALLPDYRARMVPGKGSAECRVQSAEKTMTYKTWNLEPGTWNLVFLCSGIEQVDENKTGFEV